MKWKSSKSTMVHLISRRILPLFINDFYRMSKMQILNFLFTRKLQTFDISIL